MGNAICSFDAVVYHGGHSYIFNGHQIDRNIEGCLVVLAKRDDGLEAVLNLTPDWKVESIFVQY